MSSLQGNKIKNTYQGVLKVADNEAIESGLQEITDGLGNSTGLSINNQGDLDAQGTVAFGSLKDSGEDITITKFVDEADGIANNDNDSSIPTSAAVRDYVDSYVTAQDLDISDGTNNGSIDLDSQVLLFEGDSGVDLVVFNQTVTADSSVLQAADATLQDNIDAEATARAATDTTLQSNINAEAAIRAAEDSSLQSAINTEITDRISADQAQANALSAEEAARIAADAALQTDIDNESTTRAAEDTLIRSDIESEETARINADTTLQANIDAEAATRLANDNTLQFNINAEATARASADTTLQSNIDAEASARTLADDGLQSQITSNDTDISALDTRLTTAEGNITSNDSDISGLDTRLTAAESNITSNDSDISGLDTRLTTAEGDITSLESSKQDVSEKGQPNGYASLDSNGTVPVSQLPESVTGSLEFQGIWDASTNTPTLPDPTTVKGHYYKVSVEGTYLGEVYHVGDWALSDGTAWEHIHTQETVSDVFGREGSIVAQESDYSSFYPLLSDLAATDANVLANTTKLATIEEGADVTDATNVAAAGALMSGVAGLDDLADVSVPSPSNGQILAYNETSGQWEAGAAGSAPVDSVNGQIGAVVLDADDIDDSATTNKFTTAADISKLAGIEAGADVTDTQNVVAALTAGTNITIGVDGTISSTDTNTTYTAGSGLTLAGTTFSHSDTSTATDLTASGRRYVTGLTFDEFGHITGYTTGTETVVDTNTTYSAGAGIDLVGTTFSHADTSSQASVNNSGRTYIQDITLDTYGHIIGITSATETVVDTNTTYTAGSGLSLSGTTFSHSDTSTAANLTASGRRYVTGLTFDTYGHVTGYTTGTETVVDTNTTYSAGSGLTLSGTTFSVQSDLRGEAWLIGRDNNDYINVDTTQIDFVLDGAVDMRLYNNGDLHVEGNVIGYSTSISDQKFKDDVTPIESALDKVKSLKGVEYTWNATSKKGKRDLGFIAQEVEQIIPEIVTEHTLSTGEFADNPTQSKTIDYEKITAVLVEAVKEQQKQIDELKAKLDGITN